MGPSRDAMAVPSEKSGHQQRTVWIVTPWTRQSLLRPLSFLHSGGHCFRNSSSSIRQTSCAVTPTRLATRNRDSTGSLRFSTRMPPEARTGTCPNLRPPSLPPNRSAVGAVARHRGEPVQELFFFAQQTERSVLPRPFGGCVGHRPWLIQETISWA